MKGWIAEYNQKKNPPYKNPAKWNETHDDVVSEMN